MPAINFFNAAIKFNLKNKNVLRRWIAASAKKEGFAIRELNYILCNDKFLHRLNEKYLHHDEFTDIITFDYSSTDHPPKDGFARANGQLTTNLSGDVYISIKRVKENAKLFKISFQNELHRVMIHGVLHLCGYKDKTKKQQAVIRKKEDFYLAKRDI